MDSVTNHFYSDKQEVNILDFHKSSKLDVVSLAAVGPSGFLTFSYDLPVALYCSSHIHGIMYNVYICRVHLLFPQPKVQTLDAHLVITSLF